MIISAVFNSIILGLIDLIQSFLYWPIWWYSAGLVGVIKFCGQEIIDQQARLGLMIWIKNIFTPMYGQYDIEGRIISFFVRLVSIIARFILLLVWIIIIFLILVVWISLPPLIIYEIFIFFW